MERAAQGFTLLEAARTVARGGELDAKLDALAEHVRSAVGASAALIYLLDPVANTLLPAAQAGLDASALDPERGVPVDDDSELVGRAARERRTFNAAEANAGSKALAGRVASGAALLAVPLVATDEAGGEEAEGVLLAALGSAATQETEETLNALADLCAVAVRNARLQHALMERADWLERMASTDTLTGLANRATLLRMLELEIARATRQGTELSLVLFDIDDFAGLNQRAGAQVADDVLRLVASTLADQVRLVDTIGRIGPDEFALVAPGGGGAIVARRVQGAMATIEAGDHSVSLSVGAATLPAAARTADELLAAATSALVEAKRRGAGQLVAAGEG